MSSLIWRALYAAICFVIFVYIVPLFLNVIGLSVVGALWLFIRACAACLAVLYVLFGPEPRKPF